MPQLSISLMPVQHRIVVSLAGHGSPIRVVHLGFSSSGTSLRCIY